MHPSPLNTYLRIPNYDNRGSWQSAFLGFPAMQNRNAIPCWSYLAEIHRPSRIIELGTYEGGFSVLLAILAKRLGIPFHTYDRQPHAQHTEWFSLLNANVHTTDIFTPETTAEISALIALPGTTYLLCDNGAKEQEWRTFAPSLKPGDIIGAHDYMVSEEYWVCCEFQLPRIADVATPLHPLTNPAFETAGWYVCERI